MLKELKEIVQRIKRNNFENYLVNMKSLYFYREIQTALKNKTLKLCLRRLIILITVFDINLFRARRGWGMKGNTCNFVSFFLCII